MSLAFTAVYRQVTEGYIGFVEELPGANTQGAMLEEIRANLREAVELILDANRALSKEDLQGADVIREPFRLTACSGSISSAIWKCMAAVFCAKVAAIPFF